MFNSIFAKTLYQKRIFALWWFVGVAFMAAFTLSFFHSFSGGGFDQTFENLPPAIQQIAGNADSFKTVPGYISQQLFALRIPLITVILALALFHGLLVGEEQKGVVETHLTMPISRTRLLVEKFFAALVILSIACLGAAVGSVICLLLINESYSVIELLKKVVACILVSLAFGSLSFMLGGLTGKKSLSLGFASAFTFLCYLINSMASSVSILKDIDKFLPFHYYTPADPTNGANLAILFSITAVLTLIGIVGFNRRDLQSRG